jgi:hypothetical protein
MGSQRHTRFIVPKGFDLYRVMKFSPLIQLVIKNLPATNCYCPEQTHLQNEDFTYRNDTPVRIIGLGTKGIGQLAGGKQFQRSHTRLVKGFKHEVYEQDCEEGYHNDNDSAASEKEDEPMLVLTVANR